MSTANLSNRKRQTKLTLKDKKKQRIKQGFWQIPLGGAVTIVSSLGNFYSLPWYTYERSLYISDTVCHITFINCKTIKENLSMISQYQLYM